MILTSAEHDALRMPFKIQGATGRRTDVERGEIFQSSRAYIAGAFWIHFLKWGTYKSPGLRTITIQRIKI